MSGNLHGRIFIMRWQMLLAATNPGQIKDSWSTGNVDWRRERNSHWGKNFSFSIDCHVMTCVDQKKPWRLLVVLEQWWGPDRQTALRSSSWVKLLSGKADQVIDWMDKQQNV